MNESDLDRLYQSAGEQDRTRPGELVRQAILDEASRIASRADQQRSGAAVRGAGVAPRGARVSIASRTFRWRASSLRLRWRIAVPVAAAVLAVLVLQPQLRSRLPQHARRTPEPFPADARMQQSGSRSESRGEPRTELRSDSSDALTAAPPAAAPAAPARRSAAPPAGASDLARASKRARSADLAAPSADLRERANAQSNIAIGSAGAAAARAPKEHSEVPVGAQTLARYVGTYELMPGLSIAITRDGDRLFSQVTDQPRSEIYPESETSFFSKAFDEQITFVTDARGVATVMILHQGGRSITGKRIE